MRYSRATFYILVALLLIGGSVLIWHRHTTFQIPFQPETKQSVWSVEARVEFDAANQAALVSLAIPSTQSGFELLSEYTASPGYGLNFIEDQGSRRAQWSVRNASGRQALYYRAEFIRSPDLKVPQPVPTLSAANKLLIGTGPEITVAKALLNPALQRSANAETLALELIREFNRNKEAVFLLEKTAPREDWLRSLLVESGVPARLVSVLELEDGRRRSELKNYLQVFDGENYSLIDPEVGSQNTENNLLLWEYLSRSTLDVMGGYSSKVSFSVIQQNIPAGTVLFERRQAFSDVLDFSIHLLPISEQALFKKILLIPIGVLVVCILRIFVGLRTAGTFMPVLIAIAFIQTSLTTGLIGFVLIVGLGLLLRGYLSQLNLLLVARISTVIIFVIIVISILAVMSYRLGWTEGLKVSFFPMIILSWTIERTSILWEEEGGQEVFVQVGGSLFCAVVTYLLMTNVYVQHLTFNFLGLQLIIMAVILLIGSFTGYRLLELHRFYALVKRESD